MTVPRLWKRMMLYCLLGACLFPASRVLAGDYDNLKDLMLEKGQITIDEWVNSRPRRNGVKPKL